jgi:hypothetical protein
MKSRFFSPEEELSLPPSKGSRFGGVGSDGGMMLRGGCTIDGAGGIFVKGNNDEGEMLKVASAATKS